MFDSDANSNHFYLLLSDESMEAVTGEPLNSEEAMLRKFFTGSKLF